VAFSGEVLSGGVLTRTGAQAKRVSIQISKAKLTRLNLKYFLGLSILFSLIFPIVSTLTILIGFTSFPPQFPIFLKHPWKRGEKEGKRLENFNPLLIFF
jgi:hypothetical protein